VLSLSFISALFANCLDSCLCEQKELDARVEKAKELEGQKGAVDPKAAAKDAPPQGKELPNSPANVDAK
jgi:hypothetical protein